jgi:hypothetical protein
MILYKLAACLITFFVIAISLTVLSILGVVKWCKLDRAGRFNWWLPFIAALGTLISFIVFVTAFGFDFGKIFYIFIFIPIVSITLLVLIFLKWEHMRFAFLSMLIVFGLASWVLLKNALEVRSEARWLWDSRDYKAKVLALPIPTNGELKHIDWDGWGFAGIGNTDMYLIFDPNDSLSNAAKSHSPGKFNGIPCEVQLVSRLESHYYTVLLRTPIGRVASNVWIEASII